MPWSGLLAVGGGAVVGAWLRWGLGIALNPVFPTLPLGTLAANLIGGLLMGFGGVTALGCTVGQGLSGLSTLAIGSPIAFAGIVAGSALTMKWQYWRIAREA